MALGINTNVQSLIAQKNLFRSGSSLSTSIERLSSGLRINSARDDAAGLAISERMSAQLRGMEVAKRNANDGISALQVADGNLSSLGDSLQRMRELAVQASNGTLSADDRENLNLEFIQLSEELSRVAGGAEFNGVQLLKGDGTTPGTQLMFELQIGFASDSQLNIAFDDVNAFIDTFREGQELVTGLTSADGTDITLGDLGTPAVVGGVGTEDLTDATSFTGTLDVDLDADGVGDFTVTSDGTQFTKVGGTTLVAGLTDLSAVTLGEVGLQPVDGTQLSPSYFNIGGTFQIQLATDGTNVTTVNATSKLSGQNGSTAQSVLDKIDSLLDTVNNQRATLGAGINRLDAVINNLETSLVNLGAARGRIVDADFARETANLTRTQILQQAGTAMLAQANQLPANVLSLLG